MRVTVIASHARPTETGVPNAMDVDVEIEWPGVSLAGEVTIAYRYGEWRAYGDAYLPGMGFFLSFEPDPGPVTHRVVPVYGDGIPEGPGLSAYGGEAAAIRLARSMASGPVRVEDATGQLVRWVGPPALFRFVRVRPVAAGQPEAPPGP